MNFDDDDDDDAEENYFTQLHEITKVLTDKNSSHLAPIPLTSRKLDKSVDEKSDTDNTKSDNQRSDFPYQHYLDNDPYSPPFASGKATGSRYGSKLHTPKAQFFFFLSPIITLKTESLASNDEDIHHQPLLPPSMQDRYEETKKEETNPLLRQGHDLPLEVQKIIAETLNEPEIEEENEDDARAHSNPLTEPFIAAPDITKHPFHRPLNKDGKIQVNVNDLINEIGFGYVYKTNGKKRVFKL
ncbi:hypothetical protein RFI_17731 [Reticulomyxa filosa]|uniref:Uncharacterized protein n=1 Tax=Reticulomyxa filosa TaxID=46433 RepID=X6MZP6_RETFI|nr:hypothetical protein RFI_17731 [Reticulomyxa filosa]|eukprot:ETO19500.1 hypothetical protein RFI_17731 [Reticulomyxa filosa]